MDHRDFAKHLRRHMTDAEHRLWYYLRARRLAGLKFRRQHPLGPYVVDFVHLESRVVVEADGGQHGRGLKDHERDAWLKGQGFRVLRFWNHDILQNTEQVLEEILRTCSPSPQPLSPEGRGVRKDR